MHKNIDFLTLFIARAKYAETPQTEYLVYRFFERYSPHVSMWPMRSKTELCELNFYVMHFAGVSPACLFGLRRILTWLRHRF